MRRTTLLALLAVLAAGCGTSSSSTGGTVHVVAAENFWGSIASQIAGSKASVQSIIVNPAQDPHSYEPSAADARALATAKLVIVNGVGYDPWAPKLLSANPVSGRLVLTVGDLFGLRQGDNPHRWYDPENVASVADSITRDLIKLDPRNAAYYDAQRIQFLNTGLAQYHRLIASINARYAGVPVGASESIFALLSPSLGLRLLTPPSFMKSISEGTEVTAQDTAAVQHQIASHQVKVWIYNSQNTTPAIGRLNAMARAAHMPIATVTETLMPVTASFEQWQVGQLQRIANALKTATGK